MNEFSMRKVAAVAVMLGIFSGCAHSLPYFISIDSKEAQNGVLPLNRVAHEIHEKIKENRWDIKTVQIQFESKLHEVERLTERTCKDKWWNACEIPLRSVVSKWLSTYSVQTTDPDDNMERFKEFLGSSEAVRTLSYHDLKADEDSKGYDRMLKQRNDRKSQWCGNPDDPECDSSKRVLYRVVTEPGDLYEGKLKTLVKQIESDVDRNRKIVMLGYEIPWDADRTLIRYGMTFYFIDQGHHPAEYIGYDLLYANEATPAPCIIDHSSLELPPPCMAAPYTAMEKTEGKRSPWRENPWRMTGYPFSVIIGLKNAAFEVVKMPFSLIGGVLAGRDNPLQYPFQNLRTAYNALEVELTTQTEGGAGHGLHRLLTEVPFVGQMFQYNEGEGRFEPDVLPNPKDARRKIFLSRGIYGGNKWGQDTGLWVAAAHHDYPTYDVYSPPYQHGTVTDVIWSMFNLSHGPAYNEALYIMNHAGRGDRLYLAGHSGGVQRSAAASRILWQHGYSVIKVLGIAGPSIGQAFVDTRYPNAFQIFLNTQSGENQDIVSKVGVVAGGLTTLLDYGVKIPLKYLFGGLCFSNEKCRGSVYHFADRVGFSNATITQAETKPSSLHQTPLRVSMNDRVVFDAYLRSEFATAFREDLERPSVKDTDALRWKK